MVHPDSTGTAGPELRTLPDLLAVHLCNLKHCTLLSSVSHSSELLNLRGEYVENLEFTASWADVQVAWGPRWQLLS